MSQLKFVSRVGLSALSAGLLLALLGVIVGPAHSTEAAVVEGGKGPQLLIGFDEDNQANPLIQAGSTEVGILRNRGSYGRLHERQEPAQHPCALARFESRRQQSLVLPALDAL